MSMEFHKNHFRSARGPADEILSLRASADLRHELYGISIIVEEPIWSIMLGVFEAFADAHAGEVPGDAPVVRREVYRSTRGGEPKVLRARVPGALREELDLVSASMGETRHSALLRALEEYADSHREEAARGMRIFRVTPPWERRPRGTRRRGRGLRPLLPWVRRGGPAVGGACHVRTPRRRLRDLMMFLQTPQRGTFTDT